MELELEVYTSHAPDGRNVTNQQHQDLRNELEALQERHNQLVLGTNYSSQYEREIEDLKALLKGATSLIKDEWGLSDEDAVAFMREVYEREKP